MLLKFIEKHKILDIGTPSPSELVAELIVDSPYELIDAVRDSLFYISRINWWERAKIDEGSTIGFGGPRDPRNPQTFFFSETGIFAEFNAATTADEYYRYINHIQTEYNRINLIPSFELHQINSSV